MSPLFFPKVTVWNRKPLFFHLLLCLYCFVGAKLWPLMLEDVRTLVTVVSILTARL